jgi:WD40 repeat protein
VWDAETGKELALLKEQTGGATSASFSADGRRVVTASAYHTSRIWDAETGKLMLTLPGHTGDVLFAAFSPDNAMIRTAAQVGDGVKDRESLRIITYDTRPARETFRKYLEAPPPRAVGKK